MISNTYQLLQVPIANLHITLVLIQALGELLRIRLTASRPPVILSISLVSLSGNTVILLRSRLCRSTATASEETTDGMTD